MTLTIVVDGRTLVKALATALLCLAVIQLLANWIGVGVDDSDKDGWGRSGVSVHTDYKTGLQYLAGKDGGLTPRLDADGRQMRIDSRAP